jgi:hypothetical protein
MEEVMGLGLSCPFPSSSGRQDGDGLSAPNELLSSIGMSSGDDAGAAPRRERNVSPAGEFSAPAPRPLS